MGSCVMPRPVLACKNHTETGKGALQCAVTNRPLLGGQTQQVAHRFARAKSGGLCCDAALVLDQKKHQWVYKSP